MDASWLEPLARGLGVTLLVFAGAGAIALLAGLVVGVLSCHGDRIVRTLCRIYVEVMRGTSALVQLFWVAFALPLAGVPIDPLLGGMLVLGLNCGAYASEAMRGALLAVPRGQADAAEALRLSRTQYVLRIQMPQAVPVVLPTATNLSIELLKNTSLVSLVGLADLTFQANVLRTATLADLPALGAAFVIYLVVALGLARSGRIAESSCQRWHRGMTS